MDKMQYLAIREEMVIRVAAQIKKDVTTEVKNMLEKSTFARVEGEVRNRIMLESKRLAQDMVEEIAKKVIEDGLKKCQEGLKEHSESITDTINNELNSALKRDMLTTWKTVLWPEVSGEMTRYIENHIKKTLDSKMTNLEHTVANLSKKSSGLPSSLDSMKVALVNIPGPKIRDAIAVQNGILVDRPEYTSADIIVVENKQDKTKFKINGTTPKPPVMNLDEFRDKYLPVVPPARFSTTAGSFAGKFNGMFFAFQFGYESILITQYIKSAGGVIMDSNTGNIYNAIHIYITDPKRNTTGVTYNSSMDGTTIMTGDQFLEQFVYKCMDDQQALNHKLVKLVGFGESTSPATQEAGSELQVHLVHCKAIILDQYDNNEDAYTNATELIVVHPDDYATPLLKALKKKKDTAVARQHYMQIYTLSAFLNRFIIVEALKGPPPVIHPVLATVTEPPWMM
jgi:hypothetical protein